MIIVVGGIKGGTGKTTIATNLTVMRAAAGKKVLLVDADEQKSTTKWVDIRQNDGISTPWTTIQLYGNNIWNQLNKLSVDYDDIIIDVGGRDTSSQRSCLLVADILLIPFKPRSFDVWTTGEVREMISQVTSVNTCLTTIALINQSDPRGTDNQEAITLIKECIPFASCLKEAIGNRKAFGNAASFGLSVSEMEIVDKKALQEMTKLYQHIFHFHSKSLKAAVELTQQAQELNLGY